jgi:hypothetical protein
LAGALLSAAREVSYPNQRAVRVTEGLVRHGLGKPLPSLLSLHSWFYSTFDRGCAERSVNRRAATPTAVKETQPLCHSARLHDRLEETNVVDQLLIGEAVRGASLDCVGPRLKTLCHRICEFINNPSAAARVTLGKELAKVVVADIRLEKRDVSKHAGIDKPLQLLESRFPTAFMANAESFAGLLASRDDTPRRRRSL